MPIIHGLIAVLLLAFFASPVFAADPESCTEYRVPDRSDSAAVVTGNGWKLTMREAYVGATAKFLPGGCYIGTATVLDYSASKGCKVGMSYQQGPTYVQPGCGVPSTAAPSWGTCGPSGFGLETRPVNQEIVTVELNLGYVAVGDAEGTDDGASKLLNARGAMMGAKICHNGKRHLVLESDTIDVTVGEDCYTALGIKYCLAAMPFDLMPLCSACEVGDRNSNAKPSVPDTDGDGDPDDTDPDADGDGNPDNPGGGDPGDGGDPGGGGDDGDPGDGGDPGDDGGTDPGDGGDDGGPPDDDDDSDGDGCPDSEEPCEPSGPDDGDPDDPGECDPKTEDCSKDKPGSFGGNCMAGFTCAGDAIQCAMAREQHLTNCKLFKADDGNSDYGKAKAGTDGFDPAKMRETAEKINVGSFNQSGFGWSRACPADPSVSLPFARGGAEITIPFSRVCGPLGILSLAGVGITLLGCMVWVLGSKKA